MAATLDIIIANSPGQTVNVPYKPHEPIYFLLQRIRAATGASADDVKYQRLFVNGRPLKDVQESIAYYRIFGRTLTYRSVLISPQEKGFICASYDHDVSVHVMTLTGKTLTVVCRLDMLVEELKNRIQELEGIPSEQQRLVHAGYQLQDEHRLDHYRIQDGAILHLVLRLRGGGTLPGIVFSDVSDTSGVCKVQFSEDAPPGRVGSPGTNIECDCTCTPTHNVICQRKFGILELSESTFNCPNCHESDRIVPVTVGFIRCKYRFHGIKSTGEQYTSNWTHVDEEDCYQLFSPDNKTVWRRLVIESAGLGECDDCTICLEELRTFDTLGCGHQFHTACIGKWKGFCPNCRYNNHLSTGPASGCK